MSDPPAYGVWADLSDDDLAAFLADAQREQRTWAGRAYGARLEYLQRLVDRGATEMITANWKVERIAPASSYEWSLAALEPLRLLLAPGEWDELTWAEYPPPVSKFNTPKLKALARKRGGEVAGIIERAATVLPKGAPGVRLTHLDTGEIV